MNNTNRIIKFRAWDKLRKAMIVDYDLSLRHSDILDYMQYTGLKDKNGKEIYEGDILVVRELHDGDEGAWNQPKGPAIPCKVEWDDEYKRFDFGGCSRVIYSPTHFEIIGNIYQNPELLK